MNPERLLSELKDLTLIPNFQRALYHKVEELKIILSEDIESFSRISRTIEPVQRVRKEREGREFQLARFGDSLWIPSLVHHAPVNNIYAIIPQAVVDYISRFDIEPGVIVMKTGKTFPGCKDRVYDISFERHSDRFISGVIGEQKAVGGDTVHCDTPPDPDPDEQLYNEMGEMAENLKLLVSYLLKNPDFYRHVISDFFIRWKPLMDMRLIDGGDTVTFYS